VVPILDSLCPIPSAWKLKTGGFGAVLPTMRSDGAFCDDHTLRAHLKTAQEVLKLPKMTWYQLKEMMGHSTVQITERYAHLETDLFGAQDLGTIALDLRPGSPETGAVGYTSATAEVAAEHRIA